MLTLEAACEILRSSLAGAALETVRLPVGQALNHVLADDAVAQTDLPPFNKSAMDGYAILGGQTGERYQVVEAVPAGHLPARRLAPGAAIKVMTGAPVPAGTARVIPIEDVAIEGDGVRILRTASRDNLCPQGEDLRRGDTVLRRGTLLGPLEVANLLGAAVAEVLVYRPLKLSVLSTGDEIVDNPADLGPGKIVNTNGPLLAALAHQHGFDVVDQQTLPDRQSAITRALRSAISQSDLIVVSGGVSVGDFDFVTPALAEAGLEVHFTAVRLKPGRPTTYASRPGCAVFGLPGNPVSVFLMFHLLVLEAAAILTGGRNPSRETTLPLAAEVRRGTTERTEYRPARIDPHGQLEPLEFHGSAHLGALAEADGFLILPAGTAMLPAKSPARFLRLPRGFASKP